MKSPELIVSETLKLLVAKTRPGITTLELDAIAKENVLKEGAQPYNLGYHPKWATEPFPATLCASVNDQICHGIPTDRKLESGDLVNYDLGIFVDGRCGDAAVSVGVGEISERDQKLLDVAFGALHAGIEKVRDGVMVRDIGSAMNKYCEANGFVTIRRTSGHAIGLEMHEDPSIPNYYDGNNPARLEEGMIVCIEPQVTKRDRAGVPNGWEFRTVDHKKAAFFEHMVRVTKDGYEILTTHLN
jgi:methionyl aminopeptidase